MRTFDDAVKEFLSVEKVVERQFRWYTKRHSSYSEAQSRLIVMGRGDLYGRFILTSHKTRNPQKYGFSVIFRTHRIFSLDVEPGHYHYNVTNLESIYGTHWQRWPNTEVIPDSRELTHRQWLDEFIKEAHIQHEFPYRPPPFGEQLGLNYDTPDQATGA